jgi:hypothetical protein
MAHNVTHKLEGDELVIRIKVDPGAVQSAPLSGSGKTHLVASSGGYQTFGNVANKALAYSISVTSKG